MQELSEAQIEEIAERAAKKAVEKLTHAFYREVGKSVVEKFLFIIGILAVGLMFWMAGRGYISLDHFKGK
jgi:hypothetical protein